MDMPIDPSSPLPRTNRDLRRDRSVLALAAALCGALAAAGLAAFAGAAQISTAHHDTAIADASLALRSATDLLDQTRGELEAERKAARATREEAMRACDEPRQRDPRMAHGPHDKHRGHASRGEGPRPRSKIVVMSRSEAHSGAQNGAHDGAHNGGSRDVTNESLTIMTTLPAGGIRCESEQHCQLDSAVAEATDLLPSDSPLRARFVPLAGDRQRDGVRVYRLQAGSPMKLLGFKNGDTIRSMHFAQSAQLDPSSDKPVRATLSIDMERKGQPMSKIVDIL